MSERADTISVQGYAQSFQATLVRPEGVGTRTFLVIPLDLSALYGAKGADQGARNDQWSAVS